MKGFITLLLISGLTFSSLASSADHQDKLDQAERLRLDDVSKTKMLLDELANEYAQFSSEQKGQYLLLRIHSAAVNSDFDNVFKYYEQLKSLTKNNNTLARAKSLVSTAQMLKGDYQNGFIGMYEVLDELPNLSNDKIKRSVLLNALSTHVALGVLDKAQEYSRKLLAMAKIGNDQELFCETNFHIAHIQKLFKDYEYAYHLGVEARDVCKKTISRDFLTPLFDQQLAELELEMGKLDEALARLASSEDYFVNKSWPAALASFQIVKARVLFAKKDMDAVLEPLNAAYEYAKKNNDMTVIRDASKVLALFYKEKGNIEKAKMYNTECMEASILLNEQVDKRRLGYYQAMNYRAKQRALNAKKVALESKSSVGPTDQ